MVYFKEGRKSTQFFKKILENNEKGRLIEGRYK